MNFIKKQYRKIGILGLLTLMAFAYGCSDLSSVNDNPNEPSDARTTYLLTSAEKNLADNYWGNFELGYFGNLYSQYWSETQYTEESRYQVRTGVVNNIWDDYYTTLTTLQQIIDQNHNSPEASAVYGPNANQIAVAKILKAWTYETLTDIYGDIPFEGQTLEGAANPSPKYTSQDSVYTGIITMLTEASDSLSGETAFTAGDVFFEGDAAKWKMFANSLKMRAAIRIADAKPQMAETAFQEAENAGAIVSNDDNALFPYLTAFPNNNPINENDKTRDDYGVNTTLVNFMNSNNDPRIGSYADPAIQTGSSDIEYVGFPYGLSNGTSTSYYQNDAWSRPSARVREATAPAIFMTYSEVLFNEAEAAQRGWISADPATKYNNAIQASMDYWDVDQADATTFINNHPYNAGNWRQNLGRQKWVALYMQGIQGWSVWRRLDFGLFQPPLDGKLANQFDAPVAVRYPYPDQEHNLNQVNVEAAVSNQGFSEDNQGQKLWWDKQAESAN